MRFYLAAKAGSKGKTETSDALGKFLVCRGAVLSDRKCSTSGFGSTTRACKTCEVAKHGKSTSITPGTQQPARLRQLRVRQMLASDWLLESVRPELKSKHPDAAGWPTGADLNSSVAGSRPLPTTAVQDAWLLAAKVLLAYQTHGSCPIDGAWCMELGLVQRKRCLSNCLLGLSRS